MLTAAVLAVAILAALPTATAVARSGGHREVRLTALTRAGAATRLGDFLSVSASPNPASIGSTVTFTLNVEDQVFNLLDPLWVESSGQRMYPGGRFGYPVPGSCSTPVVWEFMHVHCSWQMVVSPHDSVVGWVGAGMGIGGSNLLSRHLLGRGTIRVPVVGTPGLTFTASADRTSGLRAGDKVTFTYTVTNSGTSSMTSADLRSGLPAASPLSCDTPRGHWLYPGVQRVCTATYRVTDRDVAAGGFTDSAEADAEYAGGSGLKQFASVQLTTLEAPGLAVTVDPHPRSGLFAGQTVNWSTLVANTGDVTIGGLTQAASIPSFHATGCPGSISPHENLSCTGMTTVTQADVDAGAITNHVTIAGTTPNGTVVSATGVGTATTISQPAITLRKTVSPNTRVRAGDQLTYSYVASNAGTVTLRGVTVADPHVGLGRLTCSPAAGVALEPGHAMSCSAVYTATQADVDSGAIADTATVTSTDPQQAPVGASAAATASTDTNASASLGVTATPDSDVVAGTPVTFTLVGQNTGAVTLHDVHFSADLAGMTPLSCTIPTPATLAPAAPITCRGTAVVTQPQVDAGSFTVPVTITALDPKNIPVSQSATVTVTASSNTTVDFTATATPKTTPIVAGTTLTYTFEARNTGSRTLHDINISDPLPGLAPLTCVPASGGPLAPGRTMQCATQLVVTQAQVDAGPISNTAEFTATVTGLAPIAQQATATVTPEHIATIAMTKTATPDTGLRVGQVVRFDLTATNTGTVTLHNAVITDPLPSLSPLTCVPAQPARLAPKTPLHCVATLTVTQADVNRGTVTNVASVTALDPTGNPKTTTADASATADTTATLSVTASSDPTSQVGLGDTISETINLDNTGAVSLHDFTLTHSTPASAPTCQPPLATRIGAAGTITCAATHTVTQADANAGLVLDLITARGVDPSGQPITATTTLTVPVYQHNGLKLTVDATPTTDVRRGTTIQYRTTITNTGNVTVTDLRFASANAGLTPTHCRTLTASSLAPAMPTHCTDTYRVTRQDGEAGFVRDVFTATGHGSDGVEVEGQVAVVVPVIRPATPHSTPSGDPRLAAATRTAGEHYLTPLLPRARLPEPTRRARSYRHSSFHGWWWLLLILLAAISLASTMLWWRRRHRS